MSELRKTEHSKESDPVSPNDLQIKDVAAKGDLFSRVHLGKEEKLFLLKETISPIEQMIEKVYSSAISSLNEQRIKVMNFIDQFRFEASKDAPITFDIVFADGELWLMRVEASAEQLKQEINRERRETRTYRKVSQQQSTQEIHRKLLQAFKDKLASIALSRNSSK